MDSFIMHLRTEKAKKIIRTAEKQLLQARIKSINSILDNNIKQKELCRPNLVLSTPAPIGPQQCVASLRCSNKKRTTSGRLSLNTSILNGLWTRWRKDLTSLPVRSLMGLTTKALQLPKLSPVKPKLWVTLSYPTHKAKRSVVDMAFKPTSKVAAPSKTSWSPQGQRPYGQPKWCHILVPMW